MIAFLFGWWQGGLSALARVSLRRGMWRVMPRTAARVVAGVLLCCLTLAPVAGEAGAERIIDQRPHDLLTMKKDGRTFKIVPLEMPRRAPIGDDDRGETLIVRLLKRPEQKYQVRWRDIDKVELFEELVLKEAARLVRDGDFDTAHEYYQFLRRRAPEFPGLAAAREQCLLREAEYWMGRGDFANALVLLSELYQRNSRFPGLRDLIGRVIDRQVEEYLSERQHVAARELLNTLAAKYSDHPVLKNRREQLRELARETFVSARKAADAGKLREAHMLVHTALAIWPDLSDARALAAELSRKYPVVQVGVRSPWRSTVRTLPSTWSEQRCRSLVDRHLFALQAAGESGGEYASEIVSDETEGNRTRLTVDASMHWPDGRRPLSAVDVMRLLARQIGARGSVGSSLLAEAIETVRVIDPTTVEIVWCHDQPFWRPLLQVPIRRGVAADATTAFAGLGMYRAVMAAGEDAVRFVLVDTASGTNATQPREIDERVYPDTLAALQALRRQEIHVYDRVVPWDVSKVRSYEDVQLVTYGTPTVHLLVPNPNRPAMASKLVRRALSQALDRELILRDVLGDGKTAAGDVLTGPVPKGYAVDASIDSPQRDARVAAALINSRFARVENRTLRLFHAADPVARRAALALQTQWKLDGLGFNVVLVESPDISLDNPPRGQWDLLYLQWNGMEPAIDARRLFGPSSIVGRADPLLETLVTELAAATTRSDVEAALRKIHRHVSENASIIPLWEIPEYAIVHRALTGVGDAPVTLYQNVRHWKLK